MNYSLICCCIVVISVNTMALLNTADAARVTWHLNNLSAHNTQPVKPPTIANSTVEKVVLNLIVITM